MKNLGFKYSVTATTGKSNTQHSLIIKPGYSIKEVISVINKIVSELRFTFIK